MEINNELILLNQKFDNKIDAIKAAGQVLLDNKMIEKEYIDGMLEREETVSTYMGNYIAIPHGVYESREYVKENGISIVQVPKGINFGENNEVKILFGIASSNDDHLEILQSIAIFVSDISNVEKLVEADSKEEVIELLESVEL